MNRDAVTLATDSAVTLTVRGTEKIYNSADKLFELSDMDPMGIMIYNNLEYMGVSLEVAIKQFRAKRQPFKSVAEAADEFFDYLLEELAPDETLQRQHATELLYQDFLAIRMRFDRQLSRAHEGKMGKPPKVNPSLLLSQTIQRAISVAESAAISTCFSEIPEGAIVEFYSRTFDILIGKVFDDLSLAEEHRILLKRMGALLLHRNRISDSFTGLVFAGFGQSEIFPSLVAYKTDGVILGKVKKSETDREGTSRSRVTGKILPFAQREMVDRFLYGIDPEFERMLEYYIRAAVENSSELITDALPRCRSKSTREKLQSSISCAIDAAVTTWRDQIAPDYKGHFMRDVQNVLLLMPKQELASLAQELINLTSVKRKFSSGTESVGGPIDVAIISRIDGFVWVSRKHYFEPSLNPRYFHRKFGTMHS
jgi:hypothetical protein